MGFIQSRPFPPTSRAGSRFVGVECEQRGLASIQVPWCGSQCASGSDAASIPRCLWTPSPTMSATLRILGFGTAADTDAARVVLGQEFQFAGRRRCRSVRSNVMARREGQQYLETGHRVPVAMADLDRLEPLPIRIRPQRDPFVPPTPILIQHLLARIKPGCGLIRPARPRPACVRCLARRRRRPPGGGPSGTRTPPRPCAGRRRRPARPGRNPPT